MLANQLSPEQLITRQVLYQNELLQSSLWTGLKPQQQQLAILNLITTTDEQLLTKKLDRIVQAVQLSQIWGLGINQEFLIILSIWVAKVKDVSVIRPLIEFYLRISSLGEFSFEMEKQDQIEHLQQVKPIQNETIKQMSKQFFNYLVPLTTPHSFHYLFTFYFYLIRKKIVHIQFNKQICKLIHKCLKESQLKHIEAFIASELLKEVNEKKVKETKFQMALLTIMTSYKYEKYGKNICKQFTQKSIIEYMQEPCQQYKQNLFRGLVYFYVRFPFKEIERVLVQMSQIQTTTIMVSNVLQFLCLRNFSMDIPTLNNFKTILSVLEKKNYKGKKIAHFLPHSFIMKQITNFPFVLVIKFCLRNNLPEEGIILEITSDTHCTVQLLYAFQEKIVMVRKKLKKNEEKDEMILESNCYEVKYRYNIEVYKQNGKYMIVFRASKKQLSIKIEGKPKYLRIGEKNGSTAIGSIHNLYLHEKMNYKSYVEADLSQKKSLFENQSRGLQFIKSQLRINRHSSYVDHLIRLGGANMFFNILMSVICQKPKPNILLILAQIIRKQYQLITEPNPQQKDQILFLCKMCIQSSYPSQILIALVNITKSHQAKITLLCQLISICSYDELYNEVEIELTEVDWKKSIKIVQKLQFDFIYQEICGSTKKKENMIKKIKSLYSLLKQHYSKSIDLDWACLESRYHHLQKVYLIVMESQWFCENEGAQVLFQNYELAEILKMKVVLAQRPPEKTHEKSSTLLMQSLLLFSALDKNVKKNKRLEVIIKNIYKQTIQFLDLNHKQFYADIIYGVQSLQPQYCWAQDQTTFNFLLNVFEGCWNYWISLKKLKENEKFPFYFNSLSSINIPMKNAASQLQILGMYLNEQIPYLSDPMMANICLSIDKNQFFKKIVEVVEAKKNCSNSIYYKVTSLFVQSSYPFYWSEVAKFYFLFFQSQHKKWFQICRLGLLCKEILNEEAIENTIPYEDVIEALKYYEQFHKNLNSQFSSEVNKTQVTETLAKVFDLISLGQTDNAIVMEKLKENGYFFSQVLQGLLKHISLHKSKRQVSEKYANKTVDMIKMQFSNFQKVKDIAQINFRSNQNLSIFMEDYYIQKHQILSQLQKTSVKQLENYYEYFQETSMDDHMDYILHEHETVENFKFFIKKKYISKEENELKIPKHIKNKEGKANIIIKTVQLINSELIALYNFYKPGSELKSGRDNVKNFYITNSKIYQGELKYKEKQDCLEFTENVYIKNEIYHKIKAIESERRTEKQIATSRKIFSIPIQEISYVQPKSYLHLKIALQIFTTHRSYFFTFIDTQALRSFISSVRLRSYQNEELFDRLVDLQYEWSKGYIGNFEYLMQINNISSRSFNDQSQYYVFPWTVTNFEDKIKGDFLEVQQNFRNLTNPIGKINPKKFKQYKHRYEEIKKYKEEDRKPFLYGSFYSNPAIVCNYMFRIHPFTNHHFNLQGKKFDLKDRLFRDFSTIYKSLYENYSDIKELIPEFYYFPEILRNRNGYKFDQSEVDPEETIEFPSWVFTKTPEEFVFRMRKCLECDYVTEVLPNWIDLTFGYKSEEKVAIDYDNLYHYQLYPNNLKTSEEKEVSITILKQFGQVPKNIFQEASQKKQKSISQSLSSSYQLELDSSGDLVGEDQKILMDAIDEIQVIYGKNTLQIRNLINDTIQNEKILKKKVNSMLITKLQTTKRENCYGIIYTSNGAVYLQKLLHESSFRKNFVNLMRSTNKTLRIEEVQPFILEDCKAIAQLKPYLFVASNNIIRILKNSSNESHLKEKVRKIYLQKSNILFIENSHFSMHKSMITMVETCQKLGLVVSVDVDNFVWVFALDSSPVVISNFEIKKINLQQTIKKCLIHELGLIIFLTSKDRILVYNFYGDNLMNVAFIGDLIGDLILWNKGSTSEIVIGTKKCRLYKLDLFNLAQNKAERKSQLVANLSDLEYVTVKEENEKILKLQIDRVGRLWQLFMILGNGSIRVLRSNEQFTKEKENKIQRDRCNKNFNYSNL